MCQWGANRNPWAGYRMGPSPTPHAPLTPQTGGSKSPPLKLQPNRRPHIEHIMWGRRAAWSPLWWWPCCLMVLLLWLAQSKRWLSSRWVYRHLYSLPWYSRLHQRWHHCCVWPATDQQQNWCLQGHFGRFLCRRSSYTEWRSLMLLFYKCLLKLLHIYVIVIVDNAVLL